MLKNITELKDDTMLVITPSGQDAIAMSKKEFMASSYYIDKNDISVAIAEEQTASFDLEYALESFEDDMHDEWLSEVMDGIPDDVKERIESEINRYLEKVVTYYPGEAISW